jgi:hypothetical protein
MAKPVLMVAWPNGNSGRAGPELVGGQKLRRKAEAGYAFFDPRGGAVLISMVVSPRGSRLPIMLADFRIY